MLQSSVFQCINVILCQMTRIAKMTLKQRATYYTVVPSGSVQNNVYKNPFMKISEERIYVNSATQSSAEISHRYKALYTLLYQDIKSLTTAFGDDQPVYENEVEQQMQQLGANFIDTLTREHGWLFQMAEKSLQMGVVNLVLDAICDVCINASLLTTVNTHISDFSYHAGLQMAEPNYKPLDESDRIRYSAAIRFALEVEDEDTMLLARDPVLFRTRIIELAQKLDGPESYSCSTQPDDTRNTATLTSTNGIEHKIVAYLFAGQNVVDRMEKELGLLTGTLEDNKPVNMLPSKALTSMPDNNLLKTIVLTEQEGPPPRKKIKLSKDEGLMDGKPVSTMDIADTALELTDVGREVLQNIAREPGKSAVQGDRLNHLGNWKVNRPVKYMVGNGDEVYVVESVANAKGEITAVSQRRRTLTHVFQAVQSIDFSYDVWMCGLLTGTGKKFLVNKNHFARPAVHVYQPSTSAQRLTFGNREAMCAVLDHRYHLMADIQNAMRNNHRIAQHVKSEDGKVLAAGLLHLVDRLKEREEIYTLYYANKGPTATGVSDDYLQELLAFEVGPNFKLTVIDTIDPASKEVQDTLTVEKRTLVHEMPPYVLDMDALNARGAYMIAQYASECETLKKLQSNYSVVSTYLDSILRKNKTDMYFDAAANNPLLPKYDNVILRVDDNEEKEEEYVTAVESIVDILVKMYLAQYSTVVDLEDQGKLNFLFDVVDDEHKHSRIAWRVFSLVILPIVQQGKVQYISDAITYHDMGVPAGARCALQRLSPMLAFMNLEGSVPAVDLAEIKFQGGENLTDYTKSMNKVVWPLTIVGSGNLFDLSMPGTNSLLRLAVAMTGFERLTPYAYAKMSANDVPLPVRICWYSLYTLPVDSLMIVKPSSTDCLSDGTRLSAKTNSSDSDLIHFTSSIKTCPNQRQAPGIIMNTVDQNPNLDNYNQTSDNQPTVNLDSYSRCQQQNYVNCLQTARHAEAIDERDFDVMMDVLESVSHSQPKPSQGENIDGGVCHRFTDWLYALQPAVGNPFQNINNTNPLGHPLYEARIGDGDNPYFTHYFNSNPNTSSNVWMSNFLSVGAMAYTPHLTRMAPDFMYNSNCYAHNEVVVSPTEGLIEYYYQLSESTQHADFTDSERRVMSNYILEQNMPNHPDTTVRGVSFLNPIDRMPFGRYDTATRMGLAVPNCQYTNSSLYDCVKRSHERAKHAAEGGMYTDPQATPIYVGGAELFASTEQYGPAAYYIRGKYSSNRLVRR